MADNQVKIEIIAQDLFTAVMQGVVAGMQQVQAAVKSVGTAGDIAAKQLDDAFKTLNFKSSLDIEAEKKKVVDAFNLIRSSGTSSQRDILVAAENTRIKLESLSSEAQNTGSSLKNSSTHASGFGYALVAVSSGIQIAQAAFRAVTDTVGQFIDAAMKMDAINIQLKAISGNSTLAAADFNFVKDTANTLGLSLQQTASSYNIIAGATKNTGLEGDKAKAIFTGMSQALTAMHLPASTGEAVMTQLGQAIGKGRLQWEDFRIIMSNFPRALQIMSQALGVSASDVMTMSEAGKLGHEEIYKFGLGLQQAFGKDAVEASHSLQSELNRLQTGIFTLSSNIGDVLKPALVAVLQHLPQMASGIMAVVTGVGAFAAAVVIANIGSFGNAITIVSTAFTGLRTALNASTIAQLGLNAAVSKNPYVAVASLIAGLVVAVGSYLGVTKLLSKAFGEQKDAQDAAGTSAANESEEQRTAAAKKAASLQNYTNLLGKTLDEQRGLENRSLAKSVQAINEKYNQDVAAAQGNVNKIGAINEQRNKDMLKVLDQHYLSVFNIYAKDITAQHAAVNSKLKTDKDYYEAVGDNAGVFSTGLKQQYQKDLQAVQNKYASMRAEATGNTDKLEQIAIQEAQEIEGIHKKHSQDDILIEIDKNTKKLQHQKAASDAEIAEIKRKITEGLLSEQDGADKILAIQKSQTQNELAEAKKRVDVLSKTKPNPEEYKNAVDAVAKLEATLTGQIENEVKNREKKRKDALALSTVEHKAELDKQLANIADMHAKGQITEEQARVATLVAERKFAADKLAIAEEEFNNAEKYKDTDQIKYKTALDNKYLAEKDFADKTRSVKDAEYTEDVKRIEQGKTQYEAAAQHQIAQVQLAETQGKISKEDAAKQIFAIEQSVLENKISSVNQQLQAAIKEYGAESDQAKKLANEKISLEDQITAKIETELAKRRDTEEANSEAFAASMGAIWDNALNGNLQTLNALSDAAGGAYKNAMGLAATATTDVVDSLEDAVQAANKANESLGGMNKLGTDLRLSWGASFLGMANYLTDIEFHARTISAEFNNQRVQAFEWMDALKQPSQSLVDTIQAGIKNLNLLDKSTLDKLKGQIEQVKNAMLAFTDKVIGALKSLQDEWDNMTMSKLELEEKRYQDQKMQWQKDYNTAQQQGNSEALDALRKQLDLMDKIHNANVAELKADPTNSIKPKGYATGGHVPGAGNGDTVPAMLTPGEFVMTKSAVQFFGADFMAAINAKSQAFKDKYLNFSMPNLSLPSFSMPRLAFADGGMIPAVSMQGGGGNSFTFNITTQKLDETTVRREVIPVLEKYAKNIR